jgi:hypothetical protein
MRQKRAAWVLGLAVFGIVAFGGWKWSNRRSVERTVQVFLAAMIQGNADALVEQMDGPALESYLAKSPAEQKKFTAPIPGASCEIRDVESNGTSATVRVLWKVSGFDIWSDFKLAKAPMGHWKITDIQQPSMVPTWEQVREHMEKEHPTVPVDEALGRKLEGQAGVEVRPLTDADLDR